MKLDLWSLIEGDEEILEFQGDIHREGFNLNGRNIKIIEPIKYEGQVFKTYKDKNLNINIDITYIYEEACSRCLASSVSEVNTNLSAKLMEYGSDVEEIENQEEDKDFEDYEDVLYYKNNNLNLDEYIVEQVILSLPMRTICKEDCKGLCSKCGKDLNVSECDCVHNDIDPRLEKLKDFLPKE